jgi:hypothetical protein
LISAGNLMHGVSLAREAVALDVSVAPKRHSTPRRRDAHLFENERRPRGPSRAILEGRDACPAPCRRAASKPYAPACSAV